MSKEHSTLMTRRVLITDFHTYTDGDADFKNELIGLMINNLSEMQQALESSAITGDYRRFRDSCHKSSTTITMLDDGEFIQCIAKLKEGTGGAEDHGHFRRLCGEIVESLAAERQQ